MPGSHRRNRRLVRKGAAVAAAVVLGGVAGALAMLVPLTWSTLAWGEEHRTDERLLPGAVVAGVDVGGQPADAAEERVAEALEAVLARPMALTHDGRRWEVPLGELTARADAGEAIREALATTADASVVTLARARWGESTRTVDAAAAIEPDPEAAAELAAVAADDVERPPRDATVRWAGDGAALVEARPGLAVDRQAAAAELTELVAAGEADEVALAVEERPASVTADEIEPLLEPVAATAEAALDLPVTLRAGDDAWQVAPAELGAEPDTAALLASLRRTADRAEQARAALATTAGAPQSMPFTVDGEALRAFVAELADERIDREPRDAELDSADGWVDIVPARRGRELDRAAARDEVAAALAAGARTVELPVERTEPERTAEAFEHVLLVRQEERRLYHYVDGEIAADWPVAIGGGGSPTPTGVFAVGEKRRSPSWYNPDPDGWGEDMPEYIGPGPDNPLGMRALNWNRDGYDTLIRFHGTANVSSIGERASQGCVRLTNDDVVELFDRVPSGTPIVSVWG